MAKYKSLATEALWVDVAGRLTRVDPGDVIDIPDGAYVQVGDHGEPALFEPVEVRTPTKSKKDGE